MNWNEVLFWAGVIVFLAAFIGAGIWWQNWMTRKIAARLVTPSLVEKLDPATRRRLEARMRRLPGAKEFLAKSFKDQPDQDPSDTPP